MNYWALYNAIVAGCESSYISYDTVEGSRYKDGVNQGSILVLDFPSEDPESQTIKQNLFDNLQDDAKFIVSTIYDLPTCFMNPRHESITRASIHRILRRQYKWKKIRIEKAMEEIDSFVDELCTV